MAAVDHGDRAMSQQETYVIVGAGHAGGRAAQAMRAASFTGRIVLIGEESYPPYERPPLSKELMVGDSGLEKVRLHDPDYYEKQNIELHLNARATAIDRGAKRMQISDGTVLTYDKLLLTTGARVRRLPVPGVELDGVFYLRDFNDTQNIRTRLGPATHVVVIGGGFIGLEMASSARTRGASVTVLEATDRLMGRAVAPEIGQHFAELHRRHGVDVRLGAIVEAIGGAGRVDHVMLRGGATIKADIVVIGIGIQPNEEIAAEAGLTVDNGIVVDEFGCTSDPAIYAAGDVANQPNAFLGRRIRLESYQNAQDQAMAVARNMVGEPKRYRDSLWVWSDQYDVNLQMTGAPRDWDRLVYRGDPNSGAFCVFYLKDGRIVAINTVNAGRDMRPAQRLMESGAVIDPAQLADPNVKLLKLGKA
jgi:3-phenylpropionate/trans-cinnamate dioxygenase ferredoxin reductase component